MNEKIIAARAHLHTLLLAGEDTVKARAWLKQLEDGERVSPSDVSLVQGDADSAAAARVAAIDADTAELIAATSLRLNSVIQRFTI